MLGSFSVTDTPVIKYSNCEDELSEVGTDPNLLRLFFFFCPLMGS